MKPRIVQQWLGHFLKRFQSKWLVPLIITTILPLFVSLVLVLQITGSHFRAQQISNLLERTMQISRRTNARFREIKQASDALANFIVNQTWDSSRASVHDSAALTQFEIYRNNIANMEMLYGIDRIRVFSDHTPFLQHSNYINFYTTDFLNELSVPNPQLLQPVSLRSLNYIVQDQVLLYTSRTIKHVDMVSFYRPIYNSDQELIALFTMDFTCDNFSSLTDMMNEGAVIFSTGDGRVIYSGYDETTTEKLLSVPFDAQTGYALDNNRIVVRYPVPLTDWALTVSFPLSNEYAPWDTMVVVYVFILLATFLLSLGVGYLISHMQARRLRSYFNAVRNVDYAVQQHAAALPDQLDEMLANVRHPDEVDQLMSSFSTLMRDNLKLISGMKQHDLDIEKYKFKVLQEQINPHFLYNALETLRLCMLMERKQDALKSLDSLSRFYRIALSKGRDTISVREELDMIRNYLEIENIGYSGAIQWQMDVQDECLDLPIPKFLLQPLVENSILHSKATVEDGVLHIDVVIHIVDDQLSMIVRDNGVGIDADTLASIRESLANNTMQKGKNGFGLSNVNRRLKLFYGAEYGLEMRSVPGCTENVIILPVDILW